MDNSGELYWFVFVHLVEPISANPQKVLLVSGPHWSRAECVVSLICVGNQVEFRVFVRPGLEIPTNSPAAHVSGKRIEICKPRDFVFDQGEGSGYLELLLIVLVSDVGIVSFLGFDYSKSML